jgi:hypothetical protein
MLVKKSKFFIIVIFLLSSCHGVCYIEPKYSIEAKRLYESMGAYRSWMSDEEAIKIFGDCYRKTDIIYISQSFFGKKYILVRYGEPITYESDYSLW